MTEEEYWDKMREQQEWSERCEAADADEWERVRKLAVEEKALCTCPTMDGIKVVGSSCPVHGFESCEL